MSSDNNPVNGTADVIASIKDWAAHPFKTDMSLSGWLLFTGLIIVACILWFMVLRELKV